VSIRSVLRHRATVKRQAGTAWQTVASDLPCLLDVGTVGEPEPTYTGEQQRYLDRSGTLLTLASADLQPADRVLMTRGQSGTFVVRPDPAKVSTLTGVSHHEHRVGEVP
jgi:hypothetical protein